MYNYINTHIIQGNFKYQKLSWKNLDNCMASHLIKNFIIELQFTP